MFIFTDQFLFFYFLPNFTWIYHWKIEARSHTHLFLCLWTLLRYKVPRHHLLEKGYDITVHSSHLLALQAPDLFISIYAIYI